MTTINGVYFVQCQVRGVVLVTKYRSTYKRAWKMSKCHRKELCFLDFQASFTIPIRWAKKTGTRISSASSKRTRTDCSSLGVFSHSATSLPGAIWWRPNTLTSPRCSRYFLVLGYLLPCHFDCTVQNITSNVGVHFTERKDEPFRKDVEHISGNV